MTGDRHGPPPTTAAATVRRLLSLAALLLGLMACSSTQAPARHTTTAALDRTAIADAQALLAAMLHPADENSVSSALASLPRPLSISTRLVPNLHTRAVTDQVDSLDFGDITIEVYTPGGGGRPLLAAVVLNSGAVRLQGLAVGMSVADLLERFGKPAVATNEAVVFRVSPSQASPFELSASLADDLVTALRWSAYLD